MCNGNARPPTEIVLAPGESREVFSVPLSISADNGPTMCSIKPLVAGTYTVNFSLPLIDHPETCQTAATLVVK